MKRNQSTGIMMTSVSSGSNLSENKIKNPDYQSKVIMKNMNLTQKLMLKQAINYRVTKLQQYQDQTFQFKTTSQTHRNFSNAPKNNKQKSSTLISLLRSQISNHQDNQHELKYLQTVRTELKDKQYFSQPLNEMNQIAQQKTIMQSPLQSQRVSPLIKIKQTQSSLRPKSSRYRSHLNIISQIQEQQNNLISSNKSVTPTQGIAKNIHRRAKDIKIIDFNKDQTIAVFTKANIQILYTARCIDANIPFIEAQLLKFEKQCEVNCNNRKVSLNNMYLSFESARVLSEIVIQSNRISQLDISRNKLGDEGVVIISDMLIRSLSLVKLDLSSNEITYKGAQILSLALQKNQSLTELKLNSYEGQHHNSISEIGAHSIAKCLETNKFIAFLSIGGNNIGNIGLSQISTYIKSSVNSTLIQLDISNNNLTSDSLSYFVQCLNQSQLRELDLSRNLLGNNGVKPICDILKQNHVLQKMNLSGCGFHSKGLDEILVMARRNKSIIDLNLSANEFLFCQPSALSAFLLINQTIKKLILSSCMINSRIAGYLLDGLLSNSSLEYLDLQNNQIEDHPAEMLASILNNGICKLTHLDLNKNFVTDFGGIAIAKALQVNKKIQQLNMRQNYLQDDTCINFLQSLRGHNHIIKRLYLDQNFISIRYLKEIEEIMIRNQAQDLSLKVPQFKNTIKQLRIKKGAIKHTQREIKHSIDVKLIESEIFESEKQNLLEYTQQEDEKTKKLIEIKQLMSEKIKELSKEIEKVENDNQLKARDLIDREDLQFKQNRDVISYNDKRTIDLNKLKLLLENKQTEQNKIKEELQNKLDEYHRQIQIEETTTKAYISRIEIEKQNQMAKDSESKSPSKRLLKQNSKSPRKSQFIDNASDNNYDESPSKSQSLSPSKRKSGFFKKKTTKMALQ